MLNSVLKRDPILFCFCAPSAAGKTTITKQLAETDPSLHLSISTTTRAPRPGEVNGKEYHFVNDAEFLRMIEVGDFLEHAIYSGRRYGTGKENLRAAEASGADVLLDIDVQGVEQMRSLYSGQLVVIFIFPPSFSVLKQRLSARGSEDPEKTQLRLEAASREIAKLSAPGFSDYLLVNDQLPTAIERARQLIQAERMRCRRLDFTALVRPET